MRTQNIPKFSLVVPAYNVEKYIVEALETIERQSFENFECIIVNDGSTDNTRQLITEFASKDERFIVINQKNGGLSNARNNGFKKTRGEYVIFLDGDDTFSPFLLKKVGARLSKQAVDILIYNSDCFNDRTKIFSMQPNITTQNKVVKNKEVFTAKDIPSEIFNLFFNSVWSKVFKRDFLVKNQLWFDEELHRIEDFPFTNRALVLAQSISFIDEVLVHYRLNTPSSNTIKNYKYPLDIVKAVDQLYDFLHKREDFNNFRKSFDNAVIADSEYYLWWTALYPEGEHTFIEVKKMLGKYDISTRAKEYFHRDKMYELMKIIRDRSYTDYLQYIIKNERETRQNYSDENELNIKAKDELRLEVKSREEEVKRVNSAMEELLNSKAYKLGTSMVMPVRKIRILTKRFIRP